jgi:tetratricopeptide (TPR) repeat protein
VTTTGPHRRLPGPEHRRILSLVIAGAALVAGAWWLRGSAWARVRTLGGVSASQLEDLVRRHPDDPVARYELAKSYYRAGRFAAASDAYQQVIARDPRSARAHLGLGLSLYEAGDLPAAQAALLEALRLDPRLAWAEFHLGKIAWLRGSVNDALPHVKRAAELDPRSGPAWYGLGVCYLHLHRTEEAIPPLRQAIARDERNPQYRTALAEVLLTRGAIDEGRQELEAALGSDPEYGPACALMGNYYLRKAGGAGSLARAEELLQRAARLRTYHPEQVYFDLGDLYLRKREYPKAAAALRESIRLDPRDERPYYTLTGVYRRLGDEKAAAAAEARFQRVSRLHIEMQTVEARVFHDPRNTAARLRLARVYRDLGLHANAARQYARYLQDRTDDGKVAAEFQQWRASRPQARRPDGPDLALP